MPNNLEIIILSRSKKSIYLLPPKPFDERWLPDEFLLELLPIRELPTDVFLLELRPTLLLTPLLRDVGDVVLAELPEERVILFVEPEECVTELDLLVDEP